MSGAGRPSLLQICLSLEPSFAAYHAAWEFVLALHGGRLDGLARAWGTPMSSKEVVREFTRAEKGFTSRGYLSNGISEASTLNGGPGNDDFTVYNNQASLSLNGDEDDDHFTIRSFVKIDPRKEWAELAPALLEQ